MSNRAPLVSLRFFGLAGLFVITLGLALSSSPVAPVQAQTEDCIGCHREIGDHWGESAHGQAGSSESFLIAWEEQGNVPECMECHATGYDDAAQTWDTLGVGCSTCHTPSADSHPEKVMLTNTSSEVCGTCHLETFSQWQESTHGFEMQTCSDCHNPHSTEILIQNSERLCEACHGEQVQEFRLTAHASNDLTCIDCHLGDRGGVATEGHGRRDHTFGVDLSTCTGCHNDSRHSPHEADLIGAAIQDESLGAADPHRSTATVEPEQASEIGFVLVGILVGLGFGIVLGPWLDLRSTASSGGEKDSE